MAALIASALLLPSSVSCSICKSSRRVNAAVHVPKLPNARFTTPKLPSVTPFVKDVNYFNVTTTTKDDKSDHSTAALQLHAILEAVADRIEMHTNIGDQRDNWNSLLLNSINMMTLTATTMAGVGSLGVSGSSALKFSSTLLFSAATCMLLIMNKIQPSQLAEEQRKATRLFKELMGKIETTLALGTPSQADVKDAMGKVLALDKAYPLPLLGKMLEKFPESFEPAVWWASNESNIRKAEKNYNGTVEKNGWSEELEMEMREIVKVLKMKDSEDYDRLGNKALKMNKILAISGPLLTGIAAVSSAFLDSSHGSLAAVVAGALASTVNTFEHGGQVGMVFEMYRNSAGVLKLMEDTIESTIEETDLSKRENGELFEMKVALQLGRSVSELRGLASKSMASRIEGVPVDEFGSKLF